MILNLREYSLFESEELEMNKKITFIFGKNGTGKSTLSNIMKLQCTEYDVRIFDGFENVIGSSKCLNAVVLGEENVLIRQQIEEQENKIKELQAKRKEILAGIEPPLNNSTTNFWTRRQNAFEAFEDKESELKSLYSKSASKIKKQNNPQISSTSYNMLTFQKDIDIAETLSEEDKEKYIQLLKCDKKIAKEIYMPKLDLAKHIEEINEILQHKVEEKVIINRFANNSEKRKFADLGRTIHRKGDICAFCGNEIKEEVFEELEKYFSVDDVKNSKELINNKLLILEQCKNRLNDIVINEAEFYPEFEAEIAILNKTMIERRAIFFSIINLLEEKLNNKLAYLFESVECLDLELPKDFSDIYIEYDRIKNENNKSNLVKKQDEARKLLRLHFVKEELQSFDYEAKKSELNVLGKQKDIACKEFLEEESKISGKNGIDSQISDLLNNITLLQEQTQNEKILAKRINKKLKNMVSFELVHCENEDEKGYYMVRNVTNNDMRDVTQLSTGEKNIIAFLYFIGKLKEINFEGAVNKPKLIVFDDPMNSNDDNMQYLIIEELQCLMKEMLDNEKFVLLTHNIHFYLNVKYTHTYKKDLFLRLETTGKCTLIREITKEQEDFSTSYHALWKELKFLYENDNAVAEMMLNSMRRIIETYTKFNSKGHNAFCEKKSGAMKLFNVNSHSIDDLEADLCGHSKTDVVNIFCECFYLNDALEHFKNHWPEYDTSFLEC